MRILKLPASVKEMVKKGEISYGHARTLLSLSDEKKIELSTFVIENREIDKNLDKIEIIHSKIVKMTAENVRN